MIKLSDNILQIHYFGNKCMIKTDEGLGMLNEQVSFLINLINTHSIISLEDITLAFIKKFSIDGDFEEIQNIIKNYIYNSKYSKKHFCESNNDQINKVKVSGSPNRFVPYLLNIELTNVCNLNCSHCYKEANCYKAKYIELDALKDLFLFLQSKNLSITLTGGEPTLHKSFEKVVDICSEYGNVDLVTNGLNLSYISPSVLCKLNLIGVSLYGIDNKTYNINTGIDNGFYMLEQSINHLHTINKEFILTIVLDKEKIKHLDRYVEIAARFGAKNLQIGLPTKTGKLIKKTNNNKCWDLSDEDKKYAYKLIRELQKKNYSDMKILDWQRDLYEKTYSYNDPNNPSNFYKLHCMKCGAGTTQWSISEDFEFRPCNLLGSDFIKIIDYNTFKRYVDGIYYINWETVMKKYEQIYSKSGYKLSDCCKRMTDFLYEK